MEPMAGASSIDALPTKDFFIEMLTRDITLIPAINDLIDNSVDGARRLRKDASFEGLSVHISLSGTSFEISDNCGGIPLNTAQHYAFRFGRPDDAGSTPYSTGQFGVGMKRALFKLGREFQIESATASERFVVDVDVEEWAKREKDWTFRFSQREEGLRVPPNDRGTRITVSKLHPEVAAEFKNDTFVNQLRLAIRDYQHGNLGRNLQVVVQNFPVQPRPLQVLRSAQMVPNVATMELGTGVSARVVAGIGERKSDEAGWYIFCNDRLVVGANKGPLTGWGADDEQALPRFHPVVHTAFRGYAFLEARQTSRLPWNTTKMGVDEDSPVYKALKLHLVATTRPVIDFLRKAYEATTDETEPLRDAIASSKPTDVAKLQTASKFQAPTSKPRKAPEVASIQYRVPTKKLQDVKDALKVDSNRAVGEKTFEYFYTRECQD